MIYIHYLVFIILNLFSYKIYHSSYKNCRKSTQKIFCFIFQSLKSNTKDTWMLREKSFCACFEKFVFTMKEIVRKSQKYSMRCRNSGLIACLKSYCQLYRHVSVPWKEKRRLGQVGYNMFVPIDVRDCDTKG